MSARAPCAPQKCAYARALSRPLSPPPPFPAPILACPASFPSSFPLSTPLLPTPHLSTAPRVLFPLASALFRF